jgi:two-component system, NtrC family, sensor kinase
MSATTAPHDATLAAVAEEAQRALRDRPRLSLRTRLGAGFLLWIVISLGSTALTILLVGRVEAKLAMLGAVDRYIFEVQQARRFEKNYFLYRTNIDDALEQVRAARAILARERTDLAAVVGAAVVATMETGIDHYGRLLEELRALDPAAGATELGRIEAALRAHGAEMVRLAEDLGRRERREVEGMLAMSRRIGLGFLAVMLLLIALLATFIARQMLAPLNRIMLATRRIGEGDLTPITPRRKYHDEFSELAMAINYMMRELLRRHQLLVQTHKLKAIGTLTAGVAHELNNPINNIMLTAAGLDEDYGALSDAERCEMIGDLVREADRARDIVRHLLDFARESEVELTPLDVEGLISETLQLASNQVKLAGVRVRGEVEANLPAVYGDRHQLTQVVLNLVLNALDAMPGGGTLTISVARSADRHFVEIALADTGIGIPEQNLGSIFDPFFSTKQNAKGTGLGLSVSQGIVRQHGGDIRVASAVGVGTTFTVSLPVAKVPARMPEPAAAAV